MLKAIDSITKQHRVFYTQKVLGMNVSKEDYDNALAQLSQEISKEEIDKCMGERKLSTSGENGAPDKILDPLLAPNKKY